VDRNVPKFDVRRHKCTSYDHPEDKSSNAVSAEIRHVCAFWDTRPRRGAADPRVSRAGRP
jgi:hypothetical protein